MLNSITFILVVLAYSFLMAILNRKAGYKQGHDEGYAEGFMDGTIDEHNKNDCEDVKNFIDPEQQF